MTATTQARTAAEWRETIAQLRQREEETAALQKRLIAEKRSLSLDSALGSEAARKQIYRIDRELGEVTKTTEELAAAISQAGERLTAAEAAETAEHEQERRRRCADLAASALVAAANVDRLFAETAGAITNFKTVLGELATLEPKLSNSTLWGRPTFVRAARAVHLDRDIDLPPRFGVNDESLESAARGILGDMLAEAK